MTHSGLDTEDEILELLRDRYLGDGYQFIVRPSRDLTPNFLGDYAPDAIALKGKGGVAFEIKGVRDPRPPQRIGEIARRFESFPEWHFELILADNFIRDRSLPSGSAKGGPLSEQDFASLRSEVVMLLDGGHQNAALVMAWALLEAAGRRALAGEQSEARRPLTGSQLIEQLLHQGFLPPSDWDRLQNLLERRNAIAHAVSVDEVGREDVLALLGLIDTIAAGERV